MTIIFLSLFIGIAFILLGAVLRGLIRWMFSAIGLGIIMVSLERYAAQHPEFLRLSNDLTAPLSYVSLGLAGLGIFLSWAIYFKVNLSIKKTQKTVIISWFNQNTNTPKNLRGNLKETVISLKLQSKEIRIGILTTFFSILSAVVLTNINFFNLKIEINPYTIWLVVVSTVTLTWFRIALLNYRIFRGYYGNNLYEAKEVISFIESISDSLPPSDGGGQMKAFPEAQDEDTLWSDGMAGERS